MTWNYDYSREEILEMIYNLEDISNIFDGDITDLL